MAMAWAPQIYLGMAIQGRRDIPLTTRERLDRGEYCCRCRKGPRRTKTANLLAQSRRDMERYPASILLDRFNSTIARTPAKGHYQALKRPPCASANCNLQNYLAYFFQCYLARRG